MRNFFKWLYFGCGLLIILLVVCLRSLPDGNLHVRVMDIGQGDAILITMPTSERILVDGGPDDKVIYELSRWMPFYEKTIDMVILTHPHADHVNGLIEVLKRYQVKNVLMAGVEYKSAGYAAFLEEIYQRKIPVIFATGNNDFQLGTAIIDMLFPFNSTQGQSFVNIHGSSIVFRLIYGKNIFLFTDDMEAEKENELIRAGLDLRADFLKVGHHGSHTSSSEPFLERIKPKYAAISCGVDNKFHHPRPITIQHLQERKITLLRTDLDGTIEVTSDGENVKMHAMGK